MQTALFVSPHLDDVAFSCGGIAASLADRGWRTVLATAFTKSVLPPRGFALACQLDKGLSAEADYMALRRAEDAVAADILGFARVDWLDFPEAPHRGYGSPAALFGALRDDDAVAGPLADALAGLIAEERPDLVFAPQGLGGHVDHRRVAEVVREAVDAPIAWYRDTPYAIRNPGAEAMPEVAGKDLAISIAGAITRKITASQAYASQVGFQFGGPDGCAEALARFARDEGAGEPGERVRTEATLMLAPARGAAAAGSPAR